METQISDITVMPRRFDRKPRHSTSRSIIYVHPHGETIIENLINRRSRPIKLFRQHAEEALKERGISYSKLRWNQKAGCGCGCSPGFIAEDVQMHGQYQPLEIWVEIEEKPVAF